MLKNLFFQINFGAKMKVPKAGDRSRKQDNKRTRHHRDRGDSDHLTEMLKLCLQKICQLQADLENEESTRDPEAAGYTACALETLRFLSDHGLPPDHPMVKAIAERLLRDRD